jgi:hypothetical protein
MLQIFCVPDHGYCRAANLTYLPLSPFFRLRVLRSHFMMRPLASGIGSQLVRRRTDTLDSLEAYPTFDAKISGTKSQ